MLDVLLRIYIARLLNHVLNLISLAMPKKCFQTLKSLAMLQSVKMARILVFIHRSIQTYIQSFVFYEMVGGELHLLGPPLFINIGGQ